MQRLLFFVLSLLFLSCNKAYVGNESYFLRAKFNGELKEFNANVLGVQSLDDTQKILVLIGINGQQTSESPFPAIEIDLLDLSGNLSTSSYSEMAYDITSRYLIDGFTRYTSFNNDIQDYEMIITKLSDTEITGSFKGTLTNDAKENIVITEGEFYIPIKD